MLDATIKFFRSFVNAAANAGPSVKIWRSQDDHQEALVQITWEQKCRAYNRQQKCRHLKGSRVRSAYNDYAVTTHTFIDHRTRIKCMLCGIEAWSHSGEDYKFAWMMEMANNSTNAPSSSEQTLLEVRRGKVVLATFPDTDAGRAKLRKQFPNWDGTVNPYALMDVTKEDDVLKIPEGHSPIKGIEASTLEAGPDSPGAIIVTARDVWPPKTEQPRIEGSCR